MANRKRNWENKVSSRKSTILKTASSEKVALAKTHINASKKVGVLKKKRHSKTSLLKEQLRQKKSSSKVLCLAN